MTITAVKLTADLQQATVFYRTYDDGDAMKAMKGLQSAAGFLRKSLSEALDIRRVPILLLTILHAFSTVPRNEKRTSGKEIIMRANKLSLAAIAVATIIGNAGPASAQTPTQITMWSNWPDEPARRIG